MHVAVLGAGAFGVSTAYHVARAGHTVDVIDRAGLAGGTSGLGAGILSMALRTEEDQRLVQASLEGYASAGGGAPGDGTLDRPGSHHLGGTDVHVRVLDGIARRLSRLDVPHALWSPDEWTQDLARRGLDAAPDGIRRVLSIPHDAWTRPSIVLERLWQDAAAHGARLHRRAAVRIDFEDVSQLRITQGVRLVDGRRIKADVVVVALGAWTRGFLERHGLVLPVLPYRTHAAVFTNPAATGLPIVHDAPNGHYLRPDGPGRFLAGDGTRLDETRPEGFVTDPEDGFVADVRARFSHRWPQLAGSDLWGAWRGILTGTPDRRPLVGPHPDAEGLIVANGGNGFGFMRGYAIGAAAAHHAASVPLLGGLDAPLLAWMAPDRFWPEPPLSFAVREGFSFDD